MKASLNERGKGILLRHVGYRQVDGLFDFVCYVDPLPDGQQCLLIRSPRGVCYTIGQRGVLWVEGTND